MFKNIYKYSLNILAVLTGFAVAIFLAFPSAESIVDIATKNPIATLIIALILLFWAALLLILSTVMLFSETKREEAFLMASHTEVRDELEEKAVADAIKRTFIFNLALLAFVFALSGFSYSQYTNDEGKKNMSFGYSLWQEGDKTESKEKLAKIINKLPEEKKAKLKAKGISVDITNELVDNHVYLLPRRMFSSFGVLCLILVQFFAFKFFLFLNLRALNAEEE